MKIAYLCLEAQQSREHISGYAVHLNAMIGAFRGAGHEVDAIVLGELLGHKQQEAERSAAKRRSLRATAKRAIPASLWGAAKDARLIWYDRQLYRTYRDRLARFAPDVIYEQIAFLGAAGMRLAKELGIPRMGELHAPLADERYRDGRTSLLAHYARRVGWSCLETAQRIRVVSSALRDHLVAHGIPADRIIVQPNGVDVARFAPGAADCANLRQALTLRGRFVFGFAGSFLRWHRIDALLKGLALHRRACPEAALLIVGDGEAAAELRVLAAELGLGDSVVFAGNVPHEKMRLYYAAMDVCCMAGSNWYGSPMKLLEYAAMCKPIIAPDTQPVRDLFTDGQHCLLVGCGDELAVARAMAALQSQPALRQKLAANAYRKVVRELSWSAVAGNILRHLDELAQRAGKMARPTAPRAAHLAAAIDGSLHAGC